MNYAPQSEAATIEPAGSGVLWQNPPPVRMPDRYVAACLAKIAANGGRTTRYFRSRSARGIAADVEDALRRRPELAMGGAVAVGFIVARMLRSTSLGRA